MSSKAQLRPSPSPRRADSPSLPAANLLRTRRAFQSEVLRNVALRRFFSLLWRRQAGKSTTLSETAVGAMLANPGLSIIYASASLLLGREIVFKQAQLMAGVFRQLLGRKLQAVDVRTGKALPGSGGGLDPDALAECFESQRLEFRIRHDSTTVSRTQVIAPNPATARGWTGWVLLDEFGLIRDFKDLWEAVEPIISTDPTFHLLMATTPPADDSHYSYELTAPLPGTVFRVNPAGNWYESEARVPVHRVDIFDAYAAGVKLYDLRSGKEVTPEQHFAAADDKDAWRRNYKCEHVLGGTSACGLLALDTAQARGVGQCAHFAIDSDVDFAIAMGWLAAHSGDGPIGLGLDPATTEGEKSNPTALSVAEEHGQETVLRLILTWKTADPDLAKERIFRVVEVLARRGPGSRPRKLCVDASNEKYFARDLRKLLAGIVPVESVVGSETMHKAGSEPMNAKQFLGSRLVAELDDNHLTLPPERYIRDDWRLVKKERGQFVCVPDSLGRHGDTFDSSKQALHALRGVAARMPLIFRRRAAENG